MTIAQNSKVRIGNGKTVYNVVVMNADQTRAFISASISMSTISGDWVRSLTKWVDVSKLTEA